MSIGTACDIHAHMHTRIRMHRQLQVYGCVHTHECTRVCACHCLRVYGTQDTDGNGERSPVGQFVSSRQHRSYVQARRGHTCTYLASGCEPACRSRMRHPFTILQSIAVIVGNGRDLYVLRCARMQPDTADSTYGVADTLRRGDHPLATPDTRHQPANMPVLLGFVSQKHPSHYDVHGTNSQFVLGFVASYFRGDGEARRHGISTQGSTTAAADRVLHTHGRDGRRHARVVPATRRPYIHPAPAASLRCRTGIGSSVGHGEPRPYQSWQQSEEYQPALQH